MFPHSASLLGIPARYWGAPLLMLWSSVAIVVGSSDVRMWLGGDEYQRILVGITVVWLAFILAADFVVVSGNPFRDYGPRWDAQLRSAAISCATDKLSHVSLSLLFRKYIIVVPCDRITEAAP